MKKKYWFYFGMGTKRSQVVHKNGIVGGDVEFLHVVIVLVFIGITAMRMVAKNSSIGVEAAKKFAYIDAGVKEKNVNDVRRKK